MQHKRPVVGATRRSISICISSMLHAGMIARVVEDKRKRTTLSKGGRTGIRGRNWFSSSVLVFSFVFGFSCLRVFQFLSSVRSLLVVEFIVRQLRRKSWKLFGCWFISDTSVTNFPSQSKRSTRTQNYRKHLLHSQLSGQAWAITPQCQFVLFSLLI